MSPGQGNCIVVLCKTLYSHSTSLYPGVYMDTGGKPEMYLFSIPFRDTRNTPTAVAVSYHRNWPEHLLCIIPESNF